MSPTYDQALLEDIKALLTDIRDRLEAGGSLSPSASPSVSESPSLSPSVSPSA